MSYTEELAAELAAVGIRGGLRRRILVEVEDHLDAGAAADFGAPREIAARFADELGTQRTRRAVGAGFAALAATGIFYVAMIVLVRRAGGGGGIGEGRNAALGVAGGLGVLLLPQVAFAAGAAALLRALRLRAAVSVPAAEASVLRRRVGIALTAGLGAVTALALVAVEFDRSLSGWWTTAALAGSAAAAVVLAAAAVVSLRASRLRPVAPGAAGGLALDLGVAVPPWRFALLVAACTGAAVTVANGPLQGAAEAIATLGGYAALGRYLSLR